MATYMVNSLYMMRTTLALFEFTDKRLEMLQFQVSFSSLKRKWTYYWFFHTIGCDVNIFILKATQSQHYKYQGNGIRRLLIRDYEQIASFILNRKKWLKDSGFFGLVADKPRPVNIFIILIILIFICKLYEKKQMEIKSSVLTWRDQQGFPVSHFSLYTLSQNF